MSEGLFHAYLCHPTHLDVHPKVLDDRDTSMAVGGGRKDMEFHVRRD